MTFNLKRCRLFSLTEMTLYSLSPLVVGGGQSWQSITMSTLARSLGQRQLRWLSWSYIYWDRETFWLLCVSNGALNENLKTCWQCLKFNENNNNANVRHVYFSIVLIGWPGTESGVAVNTDASQWLFKLKKSICRCYVQKHVQGFFLFPTGQYINRTFSVLFGSFALPGTYLV